MTSTLTINRVQDPTQTTTLRIAFIRQMLRRFRRLRNEITKAIVGQDVFGLTQPVANQTPRPGAFNFPRSSDKVSAFMKWLREMIKNEILQVTIIEQVGVSVDSAWMNLYIRDSYKRGVMRARYQLRKAGLTVPAITGDALGSIATPFHVDRLGLLYTRTFNELKGITDAMDQHISRVLAQGIADGVSPTTLARMINKTISGQGGNLGVTDTLGRYIPAERRAKMLARTEVIRAHAEAQLREYKNWGIEGVNLQAEIITAQDRHVCPICSRLEKEVFKLEDAAGMIPLHPACRCAWLPYVEPV